MGYTNSDFSDRATMAKAKAGANATDDDQEPIRLSYIFFWGFMFSVVVVVGLVWIAAAYETGDPLPWSAERRMTPDETFGVIRNGVTAAAALGVGVTLFFSYRRQQTAERTLSYTAKTQRLAVVALEREGLDTLRKRYLEIATLLNSGTEFNRITALHALESLIISWRQFDNDREAAACLGLLLSTMRLSKSAETPYDKEFLRTAQRLLDRHLGEDEEGPHSWSGLDFDANFCIGSQGVKYWEVTSGEKSASPQGAGPARISYSTITGGTLRVSDTSPDSVASNLPSTVNNVVIDGGSLRLTLTGTKPAVQARSSIFSGGIINITSTRSDVSREVSFNSCTFSGGVVQVATTKTTLISFKECVFQRPPISKPGVRYARRKLVFDKCIAISSDGTKIPVNSLEDMRAIFGEDFEQQRRVVVTTAKRDAT